MDNQQQRGRSPSGGHQSHNLNTSQSPHSRHLDSSSHGLGLDPSGFPNTSFSQSLNSPNLEPTLYDIAPPYLAPTSQSFQYNTGSVPDQTFVQTQGFGQQVKQDGLGSNHQSPLDQFGHQQNAYPLQNYLDPNGPAGPQGFPLYQNDAGGQDQPFDTELLLEQSLQGFPQQQSGSINPADIMSSMSSPHEQHSPTPPNLLQPDQRQHSPGRQSPSLNQQQFHPSHQSHNSSLDPASAAFPHTGQIADWSVFQGRSFEGHRRTPSEHSDVSSVAPSPFLNNAEPFDTLDQQHSPSIAAQPDAAYQDALGIERFSISDQQNQQRISPRHSPHISPRLSPLQAPGPNQGGPPFMLASDPGNRCFGERTGREMYNNQGREPFPGMQHGGSVDVGHAGQMAPPEINIEFAGPSRQQIFEPHKPTGNDNALSPPDRGRKGRSRAKSDSFAGTSRSHPLGSGAGSPHLSPTRSLSPLGGSASPKVSRRSSTSSVPNRDYILDLADPQRPGSGATDSKRVQKHPATFQCSLCPKRFTRAYNLRSHLRTHTDERPFVCTVCGKAFARQHDRKRHEGLHSGEKKFVCKGELKGGNNWGCGRRFARADALGRHFRSEAGRICIKPLLDEEAVERQRAFQEQQMMAQQGQGMHPQNMAQMDVSVSSIDPSNQYPLPAALLAQYPALAHLQWDNIGTAGPDDGEGEISGRSSFDASSGGEYYDDEDNGGGYVSGPGTVYSSGNVVGTWGGHEWASDYEGK
ncbi:MAG: DNA-binding transcription factor [Geoglossum simile]|nr:MAG: DNA-binding transcription factor [Geoglossum simile]